VDRSQALGLVAEVLRGPARAGQEINVGGLLHRRVGVDSRYTTDKNSSAFFVGAFYRVGDAIVPTIQFEWQRRLVGAISYDLNISRLRAQTAYRGGMEVSLQWIGVFRDKRTRLPGGRGAN